MTRAVPSDPEVLLTRQELTKILPVSYSTLSRWYAEGEGPPSIRVGPRKIAYRAGDVREWLEGQEGGQD